MRGRFGPSRLDARLFLIAHGRCGADCIGPCFYNAIACGCRRAASGLRLLVETALIIRDRLADVASCRTIGAGEVTNRVSHIGVGVEKALGAPGISQRSSGAEADLHQPVIAFAHCARVATALDVNDPSHKRFWNAVRRRMLGDQSVVRVGRCLCGERGLRARDQHNRNESDPQPVHAPVIAGSQGRFKHWAEAGRGLQA